ncbi:autotransporter-associated beta strand repeat-containing protein [Paramesorhizobium deserti]|nr:autotransporter-associated beta strand repeat-containing protein [Paramesorhizobium deserti]
MRHIIGAPIGNSIDINRLLLKNNLSRSGRQVAVSSSKRSNIARFFRAALATTSALALAQAMMAMAHRPATAQTITKDWSGTAAQNDWTAGGNWSPAGPPGTSDVVGFSSLLTREAIIGFNNTTTAVTINSLIMAYQTSSGQGQIRILGGSTLTTNADLMVGRGDNQTAKLFVDNGKLITKGNAYLGSAVGGGTVTVSGGSDWTIDGTLNLAAEGLLSAAKKAASLGTVTVTGAGSTMNIGAGAAPNTITLNVGQFGRGTFNIEDQAIVTHAGNLTVGNQPGSNGILKIAGGGQLTTSGTAWISGQPQSATGTGTVTVSGKAASGTASQWTVGGPLYVGNAGKGTLNIDSGGVVTAQSGAWVSQDPVFPSDGTLNISSNGVLETTYLKKGSGVAQVNINGGILKALADDTATQRFITGFTGTEFAIGANGMTVDSNGFAVTSTSGFSGSGALTKIGAGNLTLTGANTFTGNTTVNGGTLTLNSASVTPGNLFVGNTSGASGNLMIENGSTVTNSGYVRIAEGTGTTGVVTIKGGSTWTINSNIALIVGNSGDGTLNIDGAGTSVTTTNGGYTHIGTGAGNGKGALNITGGGTLTTAGDASIAGATGSTGTVTVDGNGSSWEMANLNISVNGSGSNTPKSNGSLTVSNQATVTTKTGGVVIGDYGIGSIDIKSGGKLDTAAVSTIGNFPSGEGTVTIDGLGSKWTSASNIGIANAGKGTLIIQNKGEAVVTSGYTSVGDRAAGTLNLLSGGRLTSTGDAFLGGNQVNLAYGGGGTGTVLVSGTASLWNITGALYAGYNGAGAKGDLTIDDQGEVTVGGALTVGNIANGTQTNSVTITDGGTLTTGSGLSTIAHAAGSKGAVTVTGADSSWTTGGDLRVGNSGNGTLDIDGGKVTVGGNMTVADADAAASTSRMTIKNGGSLTTNYLGIGAKNNADGTLEVLSGGTLASNTTARLGDAAGSKGQATVSGKDTGGAVSHWTIGQTLTVGNAGTGSLTIEDGGIVTATGGVTLSGSGAGSGTLAVNGGASGAGVLETVSLAKGAGTGATKATFDGGILRATGPSANFISGFTGTQFEIASGGMTVDTNGFDVATAAANVLSGAGALTKVGAGTLTLSGGNNFSGGTTVNGGTVTAGAAGTAFGTGLLTVTGPGAAALNGFNTTVAGITGNGAVSLGSGTLTSAYSGSATTSYSGVMSGTGGFVKSGSGTQVLSGANSYTGATTISGGTLQVDGNQSAATGLTTVASGATLSGSGTLGGGVDVASGGTLVSQNDATLGPLALNINGNLTLTSGANLNYTFGATPSADPDGLLIDVGGDVDLGGATLNVSGSGFDPGGVYGLIEYTGMRSGNLVAGTIPSGLYVQTAMAGRINLVNTNGLGAFSFWDGDGNAGNGTIDGGDGVWQGDAFNANQNWLEATGTTNGTFRGGPAIFGGTGGTVKVDNSLGAIVVSSMQFMSDGYVLDGLTASDMITLTPATGSQVEIAVGDKNSVPYTTTINAGLTGTAELVKTDAGTLVLTNAGNSYTGGTRIEDGIVQISSDGNLGRSASGQLDTALTLASSANEVATLQNTQAISTTRQVTLEGTGGTFQTDAALTLGGDVGGAGALTKTGAGNLTLNGANSYGGGTIVEAGTLTAGSDTAFGAATGALTVNGGTADLNGHSMTLAGLAGSGGTVKLGDATSGASTLTLNQAGNSAYAGNVTGTGSLVKNGAGNLTLSGANTFSGGLTLGGGGVTAGSDTAFGTGVLTVNGGTADLAGHSMTLAGLAGSGGAVKLGDATSGASTLTLNQAGNSAYAGNVTGTGSLVKNGAGNLTLSGANTFSGGLTITAGTLTAGSATAFGATSNVLTVNGGTADLATYSMTLAGLKGTGGIVDLGTGTLTLDQAIDTAYAGKITGAGALKKAGAGTLTLSGSNDFTGGLTVNNGDVLAGSGSAFGKGALTVNAGTADFDGHSMTLTSLSGNGGNVKLGSATLTLDQTTTTTAHAIISGSGGLTMNGSGTLTLAGANIFTGPLTVAAGTVKAGNATAFGKGILTVNGGTADLNGNAMTLAGLAGSGGTVKLGTETLTLDQTATTSYAGQITGSGGLVMDGAGQLTLSGNNLFSGGLTVKAGTVKAGSATAFGAATSLLTVDGGVADLNGNSMSFAGLAGTGGEVKTGGATLTLKPSGETSYAGRITGSGGLTLNGAGKQVLTGASTYAGATNVNKGTLQVNGSITSATTVTGADSVLAGSGSTGAVSVVSGGTLLSYDDDADGRNRLTINGKLTVDAASFLQYDYGHTPALDPDVLMVKVNGDVDLNGTVNVTNTSGDGFGPGVYGIIEYSRNRTGTLKAGSTLAPFGLTLQQGVITGEINLVNLGTGERNWWDPHGTPGSIKGGDGIWTMARTGGEAANWADTDGNNNGHYEQTFFAVFGGTPGTVQVDGGVTTPGMQFLVDGYTIQGDPITLANPTGVENTTPGQTSIVVGNRSGNSNSHVVTIASVLQGSDMLVKEDVGTLVLSRINTYSGGTLIDDGTLQIADDRNLGALTTALTFDGTAYVAATLKNTQAIAMTRPVTLNGAGGTFETDADLTLSGTVHGAGALTKTGTATLTLNGDNQYAGGTFINAGTVSVSADKNLGAVNTGITLDGGTLKNTAAFTTSARTVTVNAGGGAFETDADLTLAGVIRGPATGQTGPLEKKGAGRLILTADSNDYTATMTVSQGELVFGNASNGGGTAGSIAGPIVNNAALSFDRSNAFTYAGLISGTGTVTQKGSGETTLTGKNSYKGSTTVRSGTLIVNGDQSAATGDTLVQSGATLRGKGTIGGDVTVASGGALTAQDETGLGASALTINGDLSLNPGADLNYNYGTSPNGDHDALMIQVGGKLDLNGTLNVTNTSGQDFEVGVYGLIRYSGALSGAGLTLGAMPGSDFLVQTSVDGRINLAYTAGQTLNFWDGGQMTPDGKVEGGSGTWQAAPGSTNWTIHDGSVHAGYADDSVPVFMGTSGTVTVDDSLGAIRVAGMQFAVSGYTVEGDAIELTSGRTGIRVGEHSHDSRTFTATIASELTGAGQLAKTDLGTLILTGANSYTGGTLIDAGTLQIAKDQNLGAAGTGLALDGGTLQNTEAMSSSRNVTLDANGGTFQTDKDLTLAGRLTGSGSLTKTGAATLLLSGTSTYSGATFVKSGTLAAGRAGSFSSASAFDLAAGGTLDLKGYDQGIGALVNAGTVKLAGSIPGATLTVNGDYTGKDGGTVALSTRLEGDDSKTDRLVVKGATSGSTTLAVTNAGGGGAQTEKGIKLVEVDGASNATFALQGDYLFQGDQALVAGAYAYRLFQNGIDTNDGDWYLRSSLLEGDIPQFQAGVPVYEAYAGVLQSFNQFDTLQSRLGNRSWTIEAQGADGLSEEVAPEQGAGGQSLGVWGNIEASAHRYRPERSTSDTDYDAAVWKMEAGIDGQLHETEAGRLIGGASLHYGTIAADIFSPHGEGKIDTTGYGIAGTLTWYGSNGFYLDGQAKVTWYDSDLSSATAGQSLVSGNDGLGYGLSIEAGKRIPVRPDWFVTPQAQLAWSRVDFDGFSDGFDATVTLNDGDSVIARMGLAVDHENQWQDQAGQTRRIHAYGIANLYYDFDSGTTIDVASTPFTTRNEPLWAGIGLGGSYNWNDDKFSIYGQALAKTSLDNFADSNVISGNIGIRVKW